MKTFNSLMSEVAEAAPVVGSEVGLVKNKVTPEVVEHLKKYADSISKSFQPRMKTLLASLETELNKFGYTLGELDESDNDQDTDESGDSEDFVVKEKASGEVCGNVYITIDWEKLSSGSYAPNAMGTAHALLLSVTMTVHETTPEELNQMLDNAVGFDTADADDLA